MKRNQMIILGIAAIVLAYFAWQNNQKIKALQNEQGSSETSAADAMNKITEELQRTKNVTINV